MKQYLSLVEEVLRDGVEKSDRTGVGTISIFGAQRKYDLRDGFPLLTTKKVLFSAVLYELLWFLRGSTNINDDLVQHTPIWNAWADSDGDLGPIYGYQWRKWEKFEKVEDDGRNERSESNKGGKVIGIDGGGGVTKTGVGDEIGGVDKTGVGDEIGGVTKTGVGDEIGGVDKTGVGDEIGGVAKYKKTYIDQIAEVIDMIKNNPDSRRIIVSAWNVADIPRMKLPPCHAFFQFYVVNGRLDLQLYQRSADIALGVPFNIASYSALLMMVAQECGLTAGVFTHTTGDTHIYSNHVDGLKKQLERTPKKLPQLLIAKKPFDELKFEDFEIKNYEHDSFIKFPIAV